MDKRLYANVHGDIYESVPCDIFYMNRSQASINDRNEDSEAQSNVETNKCMCKNFVRGCSQIVYREDRHKHECECEFNAFKCVFSSCSFVDILPGIRNHLEKKHQIVDNNEALAVFDLHKDRVVVFCCYESIFRCLYYIYDDFVEFLVVPYGIHVQGCFFRVTVNGVSRKSPCVHWNAIALDKGVMIRKTDIETGADGRFEAKIKILYRKHYNV
ncbi:unnamed protein product [Acanthoscelides obtectus]|uniref:SIAH-type domain-containing protein n=1 Tax=Acanthoscelides obtectus TaxID=200917 RepID=A0A9P0NZQ8_ACAOB|nr:unnamed protein product [Acanthoscelides obtectus]CAK1648696.1 hypothetical protein AOBTE_LOCUS15825 [Acanthoscelides obtectus]